MPIIRPDTKLELTVSAGNDPVQNHAGDDRPGGKEENPGSLAEADRAWRFR
jgi:hypothetical protein